MDGRLELIHWNYEEGKVSKAKADKPLEITNAPAGVAA
jgi:hypothetical protein